MKKTILPILCLFFFLIGPAQVSKTVNVATAGTVSTLLTSTAKSTVTNLTVTGTIDARDFVTMRDNMPALAVLDISAVNIAAYNGSGGTYTDTSYPANQLPEYSFSHGGTAKTSLVTIKLPDSIDSIGPSAFQNCTGLTSMVIPDLVTSIGGYAFYDCPGLSSITLPSSIILIGKSAFAFCTITTLTIPNSVTTIGDYAFASCSGLITVDANNPNYSSKDGVLFDKNQTTLIQCPVSKTGSYTIPSSVTSIGVYAFVSCKDLTSIAIPSSVISFRMGAFGDCSGLTSLIIPSSVTSIGDFAFWNCTGLTSLYASATSPVNLSSLYFVFLGVNTNGCTLYVPKGSLSLYKAAYLWNGFVNIAEFTPPPTSVTSITTSALKGYTQNGQLIVTGMNQGETLTVYTIQGTTIYSHTTDGNQVVVNLPARGIYIVKAGAQSVRVVD